MSKRSPIPNRIRSRILIANRHSCCVCGHSDVQIHHINGDSSDNRDENLAVLCLNHHSSATSPPGLTARLKPEEIIEYKLRWEEDCQKRAERLARSRTAFFMVDYKNSERIRQLYSQLSLNERKNAYTQLRSQLQEETTLREQKGFNFSLEPTLSWNVYVETFLEEIMTGNPHPEIFQKADGHPKDPLYPVAGFERMPPYFVLYDIWCQIMVRAIIVARGAYDLEDLITLENPAESGLEGSLVSFIGNFHGDVAFPDEWEEKPVSKTTLALEKDSTIWKSELYLKTHYIYSDTAVMSLDKGKENGILVFRSIELVEKQDDKKIVIFKSTPLIIGSGVLNIP